MTESNAASDVASSPFDAWLADDAEVAGLLRAEAERQSTTLQLIASENFTSPAVLAATGSVLTNKYAEGYPGRRYYGGNQVVDEVEDLARERAKALFGAEHANVQPHAGANANLAVYQALLEPGDTILAMRLDQGGHLTHGSPASITSKFWRFVSYGVTPALGRPGAPRRGHRLRQGARPGPAQRPKLIVAGATAYSRLIDPEPFREIADAVGALLMFDVGPPGRPDRRRRAPEPGGGTPTWSPSPPTRPCAARAAAAILCRAELAKEIDSAVFPGLAGRAARARHRGQGGGVRRGRPARVRRLRRRRGGQRRAPWPRRWRPRAFAWSRAGPTTTWCWWTCGPSTPS